MPEGYSNLIWVDGKNVPSIKIWTKLIQKQFVEKPELNKKISGLITFTGRIGLQENVISIINTSDIVINEKADNKISNWIVEKII